MPTRFRPEKIMQKAQDAAMSGDEVEIQRVLGSLRTSRSKLGLSSEQYVTYDKAIEVLLEAREELRKDTNPLSALKTKKDITPDRKRNSKPETPKNRMKKREMPIVSEMPPILRNYDGNPFMADRLSDLDRESRLLRLGELVSRRYTRAELIRFYRDQFDLKAGDLDNDLAEIRERWMNVETQARRSRWGFETQVRAFLALIREAWRQKDLSNVLKAEIALAKLLGYLDGDPFAATDATQKAAGRKLTDEEIEALVVATSKRGLNKTPSTNGDSNRVIDVQAVQGDTSKGSDGAPEG